MQLGRAERYTVLMASLSAHAALCALLLAPPRCWPTERDYPACGDTSATGAPERLLHLGVVSTGVASALMLAFLDQVWVRQFRIAASVAARRSLERARALALWRRGWNVEPRARRRCSCRLGCRRRDALDEMALALREAGLRRRAGLFGDGYHTAPAGRLGLTWGEFASLAESESSRSLVTI